MTETAIYPSLRGRVVLITGGASGIGAAHVMSFSEQGAIVGFVDIDVGSSRQIVEEVAAAGYAAPIFIEADLRDIPALQRSITAFAAKVGDVDILLNNAAHDQRHSLEDLTVEYFDDRIAVNLRHIAFATQSVVPGMRRKGRGSIVNFSSFSWRVGLGGMPIYVAAKAGIEGLTRALARDLGDANIRVNCIVPGWVMTKRQLDLWVTDQTKSQIREMQCLKSLVGPADVSRMALWLASDDNRMCTSQTFVVDGGWS